MIETSSPVFSLTLEGVRLVLEASVVSPTLKVGDIGLWLVTTGEEPGGEVTEPGRSCRGERTDKRRKEKEVSREGGREKGEGKE